MTSFDGIHQNKKASFMPDGIYVDSLICMKKKTNLFNLSD